MSFHHDYRRRCCLCRRLLPTGCAVCPDGCRGAETPTSTPLAAEQRTVAYDAKAIELFGDFAEVNFPKQGIGTRVHRFRCGCPAPWELPAFAAAQMVCREHARSDDALAPGGETATAVVAMVRRTFTEKRAPVRPAEHLEKPVARRKKVPEAVQDLDADWIPDGGLTDEEEGRKAALLARKAQEGEQAMDQRSATVKAATARKTARERAKRAGVECEEAQ